MKQHPLPFWFLVAIVLHLLLILPFVFFPDKMVLLPLRGTGVEIVRLSSPHPPSYLMRGVPTGDTHQRAPSGTGRDEGSGDESGKDQLLAEIRKRIEEAKRYPMMARRQGVEGVVQVSFIIGSDGSLEDCRVVGSSGSSLLDEEALATMQRGGPYPRYPEPLQVAIEFSLAND